MILMQSYPVPADEPSRLAALHAYAILDTPPEAALDDVVTLARDTFGVEASLVSLVDRERQWFKARAGWDGHETGRDCSFCSHAILSRGVMVVPDATTDARFRNNPLVVESPAIRFYAGAPLVTSAGHAIGTLCLIDSHPRDGLASREQRQLTTLSHFVMAEIDKRIGPAERRAAARRGTRLDALLSTYRGPQASVEVANLSTRGALIRGAASSIETGAEVMLTVRRTAVVATVMWTRDDLKGLAFHKPLEVDEVNALTAGTPVGDAAARRVRRA